jgi:hypothetical protein
MIDLTERPYLIPDVIGGDMVADLPDNWPDLLASVTGQIRFNRVAHLAHLEEHGYTHYWIQRDDQERSLEAARIEQANRVLMAASDLRCPRTEVTGPLRPDWRALRFIAERTHSLEVLDELFNDSSKRVAQAARTRIRDLQEAGGVS